MSQLNKVARNALITGSTSGIGLAIARALAAQGLNVTLNGFGDAAEIEAEQTSSAASASGRSTAQVRGVHFTCQRAKFALDFL